MQGKQISQFIWLTEKFAFAIDMFQVQYFYSVRKILQCSLFCNLTQARVDFLIFGLFCRDVPKIFDKVVIYINGYTGDQHDLRSR